jgi:TP901 family phage tail tape measure protein
MSLQVGELFVKLNLDSTSFSKMLQQARNEIKQLSGAGLTLKANLALNTSSLQTAKTSIGGISNALRETQSTAASTGRSFFSLGEIIKGALSYTVGIGITNVLRNLANGIGSIIPSAAKFQEQMSGVQAVLGPSETQFENLRNKAIQLGKDTKFSAAEAADGIEQLAKNGLNYTQIMNGAIDATLSLAAATGSNLGTSADIATAAIQQFNLDATQMPEAVNQITGAVNASKFDIDDYRLAIGQAGGVVGSTGTSFLDFNTAIAGTSQMFNSGSDAGTSFKTFMLRLQPTTHEATLAMKELGIITKDGLNQFFNADGSIKPFIEIIHVLQNTLGDLSTQSREAYIKDIFGQDAIRAVNGLLAQTDQSWKNLQATILNTDAAEQARIRMNNLNGVMEVLNSSFETLSIRIGENALPGLMDLGRGAVDFVNTLTTLVEALGGSKEAFNSLSPALQTVLVGIQGVMDYFSNLASVALSWGQNVGSSFASGIIDAASSVIDALMEMGSWISYWLSPGSPPRVAPDLDKWGTEVAQVYFDAFGDADFTKASTVMKERISRGLTLRKEDFEGLRNIAGTIQDILSSSTDGSTSSKLTVVETMLGSRDSIKKALLEFENTGKVSRETYHEVIQGAGAAGDAVKGLLDAYFQQRIATDALASAQRELTRAQERLNDAERAQQTELDPLEKQLAQVQAKEDLLDLEEEIKKQTALANAVGGDGSIQAAARAKLEELNLKKQILLIKQRHATAIDSAQTEVDTAQNAVDQAQEQVDAAAAQMEFEQTKLQYMMDQNDLVRQQIDLTKQLIEEQQKALEEKTGAGGKTGKSPEQIAAEKAAKAQEEYTLSTLDTAGKLDYYRNKLGSVEEGSADYYSILEEITKLEDKQAKERQKAADEEEKEKQKQIKAQEDYEYSIADTAGKLDILHKRLGTVQEGSEDYYKILKQIHDVEEQQKKEQEQAARASAGRAPDSTGLPMIRNTDEDETKTDPLAAVRKGYEDTKEAIEKARQEAENFKENVGAAKKRLEEFLKPLRDVAGNLQQFLVPALAALATPAIIAGITSIAVALAGILSPITLISLAVGALVYAWQTNFLNIQGYVAQAWEYLQSIFNSIGEILTTFWSEHGEKFTQSFHYMWEQIQDILRTVMDFILLILGDTSTNLEKYGANWSEILWGAWKIIAGVFSGALTVIQGILDVFIGFATGNWQKMWLGLNEITDGLTDSIRWIIEGVFTIVAGLFGTTFEETTKTWDKLWSIVKKISEDVSAQIFSTLNTWSTNILTWLNTTTATWKTMWTNFWSWLTTTISTTLKGILDNISRWKTDTDTRFNTFIEETTRNFSKFWRDLDTRITTWVNTTSKEVDRMANEFLTRIGTFFVDLLATWGREILKLVDKIKEIKTLIINALTNQEMLDEFFDAMWDIGSSIVAGVVKGIMDNIQKAINAMKKLTDITRTTAEDDTETHSPSEVYRQMGEYWVDGLALGINEQAYKVTRAMGNITMGSITTAGSLTPVSASAGITNYNFTIDARGSTMTEKQFRDIAREEMNKAAQTAGRRVR